MADNDYSEQTNHSELNTSVRNVTKRVDTQNNSSMDLKYSETPDSTLNLPEQEITATVSPRESSEVTSPLLLPLPSAQSNYVNSSTILRTTSAKFYPIAPKRRSKIHLSLSEEPANQIVERVFDKTAYRHESINLEPYCSTPAVNRSFLTPIFNKINTKDIKEKEKSKLVTHDSSSTEPKPGLFNRLTSVTTSLRRKPSLDKSKYREEIEKRNSRYNFIQPIMEELIKTEESYVENLWKGINNYGNIFERPDLPFDLKGKQFELLGDIEKIAEFHRDEFLPMLQRNQGNLKRLFDEFQRYIEQNFFYSYVSFTMNKQRSAKLYRRYKVYFELLQTEFGDKLGISSFLLQPIQRMARYPLLLQQFMTELFKNRDFLLKPIIKSCCHLEKKLRVLLTTINESGVLSDIVYPIEFDIFSLGKFRKVFKLDTYDHTLKRAYPSKVFLFEQSIVYTEEIADKQLIVHGQYQRDRIGISAETEQLTLYYDHRNQQECDFMANPKLINHLLELILEMIQSHIEEERTKLLRSHSRDYAADCMTRELANLKLFRNSSRFSMDSGIGMSQTERTDGEDINNHFEWCTLHIQEEG